MKKVLILLALALSVGGMVTDALAWEFSLKGEAEWRYRYIARTGPGDLFGRADVAQATPNNGTSIGFAGPQAQAVRLEGYSSKGSDAGYAEQRFWLFPEFRINPAVRLRAVLTMQGNVNANYSGGGANWVTNPHYSGWIMMDSRDLYAGTGLAVPVVRAFWGTAQTPWGIIAIGTRPGGFGMGWLLHQDDSYARSLALIVPYGPLTFIVSQYLHTGFQHTDPNDDRNIRLSPFTINSGVDQNEVLGWNTAVALTYKSEGWEMGSLFYLLSRDGHHYRAQPGGTYQDDRQGSGIVQVFTDQVAYGTTNVPIYLGDAKTAMGITYLSYTNGRFFANAEYDYVLFNARRNGGRPIAGFGQAWACDLGVMAGPAKVTLAHFYRSGHDRRGGWLNLNLATGSILLAPGKRVHLMDRFDYFIASFLGGGDSPINPYCFLIGLYGAGNNSYTTTGSCVFEDFLAYAARVDYAVAANLNVFTSVILAQRASNTGSPQGFFTGSWGITDPAKPWLQQANNPGQATISGNPGGFFPGFPDRIPNVPDNDLGWEIDAGFQWKLLEGLTFKLLFAYWQPGKWFNWAYRDMTVSNPGTMTPTDMIRGVVNPGRIISPIMAWQGSLMMDF